jgi:molybdopterin converting factor small subunit
VNSKLSTICFKLALVVFLGAYLVVSADFCQPKKLTKGQLKQKIAENYEYVLRQTSKIAEINALVQQELHEHIAKLINDDVASIFKTYSVGELNNYYEKLKNMTEENDRDINRLMRSLHGLKSNFVEPVSNSVKNKNS